MPVLPAHAPDFLARLRAFVGNGEASTDVRSVVMTGSPGAFCAGGDLGWMRELGTRPQYENVGDALRRLDPSVEVVVLGGDRGLALCADGVPAQFRERQHPPDRAVASHDRAGVR